MRRRSSHSGGGGGGGGAMLTIQGEARAQESLASSHRELVLEAPTEAVRDRWVEALNFFVEGA